MDKDYVLATVTNVVVFLAASVRRILVVHLGWGRGWGNMRRLIEYDGRLCKCLCLSLTIHRQDFECPCYLNSNIQNVRTVTIFENVDHIENKSLIRHLFIFFIICCVFYLLS